MDIFKNDIISFENNSFLIVDDEAVNRELMKSIISNISKKIKIHEAKDGEEAYNIIKNNKIDVVFLDIIMPNIDGFRLIELLKKDNLFDDIIVIVVSALEDLLNLKKAFQMGVHDYLTKPIEIDILKAILPIKIKNLLIYKKNIEYLKSLNLKIEAELKSKLAELFHSDRLASMGVMTTSILHEINTPLTYLKGNIDLFSNYFFNFMEKFKDYFLKNCKNNENILNDFEFNGFKIDEIINKFEEMIKSSQIGISRIIETINNFRLFAKKDEEHVSYFNVNDLIENVIKIVGKTIENKVNLILEKGEVKNIKINKSHFEQIMINILLNSYQAIETKGKVIIKTFMEDDFNAIEVIDNGKGMDEDTKKRVFEPFFSTKGEEGTGLGLYITSLLVKNYSGVIYIDSEINKGTKIKIKFPIV
jgi:signal transduction histidine kinase